MNSGPHLTLATDAQRFGTLSRLFEALCARGEPDELARVLAEQLRDLIRFDHLDALILKGKFQRNRMARVGNGAIGLGRALGKPSQRRSTRPWGFAA